MTNCICITIPSHYSPIALIPIFNQSDKTEQTGQTEKSHYMLLSQYQKESQSFLITYLDGEWSRGYMLLGVVMCSNVLW